MGIVRELKKWFYKKNEQKEIEKLIERYSNVEKIIFISTPFHGNLGDQAIAIAIKKYLEDRYKGKLILEISFEKYNRQKNIYEKLINEKDVIYLIGGGNFGNLYLHEEEQRRDIVKRFPKNTVVIMPQSISYTNDEEGIKEIENSKKIYNNRKNLYILTRDIKSFEFAKKNFIGVEILLLPDSVLYLEDYYIKEFKNQERKGVLLILRSDKEKKLSDKKVKKIEEYLLEQKIEYIKTDTIVPYTINCETREYEVEKIIKKIGTSKINITDRFHGLIFSVITRTPVIVFKSLDHKIEEGVKWFKDLEWVHYVTEDDDIEKIIKKYLEDDYKIKYNLNYKLKIFNTIGENIK